ncbi:hypothetical protein DV515_00019898, partial [Chloebia gouldiae]
GEGRKPGLPSPVGEFFPGMQGAWEQLRCGWAMPLEKTEDIVGPVCWGWWDLSFGEMAASTGASCSGQLLRAGCALAGCRLGTCPALLLCSQRQQCWAALDTALGTASMAWAPWAAGTRGQEPSADGRFLVSLLAARLCGALLELSTGLQSAKGEMGPSPRLRYSSCHWLRSSNVSRVPTPFSLSLQQDDLCESP